MNFKTHHCVVSYIHRKITANHLEAEQKEHALFKLGSRFAIVADIIGLLNVEPITGNKIYNKP